jgi:bacteriocin biosynthesis cyclodehydratase domain-containing protein
VFSYGRSTVEINGTKAEEVLAALLPMLDGNHGIDEILARFPAGDRQLLIETMELMSRRELLLDGPLTSHKPGSIKASTFLQAAIGTTMHPSRGAVALESTNVGIVGPSRTASLVRDLLLDAGIQILTADSDAQLHSLIDQVAILLVAPSLPDHERLSAINLQCLETRTTWLPILPFDGEFAVVGPVLVPWETCCYECLMRRRDANSTAPGMEGTAAAPATPPPSSSSIEYTLAGLCALTTMWWVCDRTVTGRGTALVLHVGPDISVTGQKVYRVPRCSACSGRPGGQALHET